MTIPKSINMLCLGVLIIITILLADTFFVSERECKTLSFFEFPGREFCCAELFSHESRNLAFWQLSEKNFCDTLVPISDKTKSFAGDTQSFSHESKKLSFFELPKYVIAGILSVYSLFAIGTFISVFTEFSYLFKSTKFDKKN